MGYTHYWDQKKHNEDDWKHAITLCNAVIESVDYLGGPLGERLPEGESLVSDEDLCFNGVNESSHETFFVNNKETEFEFCKTARKDYDLVVTACLAILAEHLDNFNVSSDGDKEDWNGGVELARQVTGLDIRNPIN